MKGKKYIISSYLKEHIFIFTLSSLMKSLGYSQWKGCSCFSSHQDKRKREKLSHNLDISTEMLTVNSSGKKKDFFHGITCFE